MSKSYPDNNSTLLLYGTCDQLRHDFLQLKKPEDIARLLEVSYDRLVYHIYKVPDEKKYTEFLVAKRSGSFRTILAPDTALKIIQRKLSQVLYSVYEPKAPVHGFVPDRSIVTNAKKHAKKRFLLNIDLQDFFGTIHFGRVRGVFMAPPYNCPEKVATVLAQTCCHYNMLPQGAPTSPVVSNMVCARLDSALRLLAKRTKSTFTRYADDITFSTTLSTFPKELAYINIREEKSRTVVGKRIEAATDHYYMLKSRETRSRESFHLSSVIENIEIVVGEELSKVISDNGFKVNPNKTRLQHKTQHQEVTGLTVNKFPNVNRKLVREVSSMLHVWSKFGLISAQHEYGKKLSEKIEISAEDIPFFQEVVRGKINLIGMVRGKDDDIYRKYMSWYNSLVSR